MMKEKPCGEKWFCPNWMALALNEAHKAYDMNEVPVGAVLVKDNELIATAHNQMHQSQNPLNHAESLVIEKGLEILGQNHLRGCLLYVTLEPCCMCAGAIELAGIETVYFGAYDLKMGQIDNNHRVLSHSKINVYGGFFEKECAQLLVDFFKMKR
ncbi:MAG: nucleoside deaminase [Alphaproteobacteria bacterium]|nr:nucleoside deaminase [Alphaproteobacteria bacterium]MBX9977461.1 nucleoside deaminase [Alphaproteobacteria bacterium]